MDLRKLLNKILDELRGAWRFRWLGIAAAWVVCLVGWTVVFTIPDTYEANARVYVDTRSMLRPLLEGLAINPDISSGLDLVRQVLLSRPQIERVAHEADLDLRAVTPAQKEDLIRGLQERISISAADMRARTSSGEGLYLISFRDGDRNKAIDVVKKLLNAFVESTLGDKRTGQETAQRFIDEQISEYEKRLREAEQRLAEFKKANVGLMPDSRGDYFGRMQQESADLEKARQTLAVAEGRRTELQRQLSGEEPFLFGFDAGTAVKPIAEGSSDLTYRIQDLQKQLDELLLKYTEKHPEVIATRQTLEELKKRQQEELARVKSGSGATGSLSSSLKQNPVYQSLQIDLKRTEVQVAELRQDVAQRETRVAELKRSVNAVPEVEAELARLNRDYDVTRQKYLDFVQRRETANISEQADRTGTVKFEIIEPPSALREPVSPNRPRLLSVVLILGLAIGAGVTWLMNQLKPVFHSARTLTELTGLPVFAVISRTWVERSARERRVQLLKFSAAALLLIAAFSLVSLLQQSGAQHLRHLIG